MFYVFFGFFLVDFFHYFSIFYTSAKKIVKVLIVFPFGVNDHHGNRPSRW